MRARGFLVCLAALGAEASYPAALSAAEPDQVTQPETWVLEHVKRGEDADFRVLGTASLMGLLASSASGQPCLLAPPLATLGGLNPLRAEFLRKLLIGGFNETKGQKEININSAVILGNLDLTFQNVPYDVALWGCDFQGHVDFFWSKVAGLHLSDSSFRGRVIFRKMTVERELRAIGTHFLSTEYKVQAVDLVSKDVIDFSRSSFAKGGDFSYSTVSVAEFERATFGSDAVFTAVRADTRLNFKDVTVTNGRLRLYNTKVTGTCELDQAEFQGELDLENLSVDGTLSLKGLKWSEEDKHKVWIDRLSYGNIEPLDGARQLLKRAEYSADAYSKLESSLRRQGRVEEATAVGQENASRQRHSLGWLSPRLWWSWLWLWIAGNGYHPEYALWWAVGIVVVCGFCFPKDSMNPVKKDEAQARTYSRWLYSLDTFVPAVTLEIGKLWEPRDTWRRRLMYCERFLGYIIVPIGLVALTGLVKQ